MQFTIANTARTTTASNTRASRNPLSNRNVRLWTTQAAFGALFIFAGAMKVFAGTEQSAEDAGFPLLFLQFIGVCELAGGFGLLLPHLLGIARPLTSLAAAGLAIIMAGAVVSAVVMAIPFAIVPPLLTGLACAYIARGRYEGLPFVTRS